MRDGDRDETIEIAVSALLARGFEELAENEFAEHIPHLTKFVTLLFRWAARMNLTGHRDPLEMTTRLILDAAALAQALPEIKESTSLADLGSGAGFPGLPLAILYPHLTVHLVDSRSKRIHFQRAVRRALELPNVQPILGRSDEIEPRPSDIVIAQAMAQPEAALGLMRPWASQGALLALPASLAASPPEPPHGISPIQVRVYRVPQSDIQRKLWVSRRSSD